MDVAVRVSETRTNFYDKPLEDVVIQSIRVDTKGADYSHFTKLAER